MKKIWLKTPLYMRELAYFVFGLGTLFFTLHLFPVLGGYVVGFCVSWGLASIAGWIGDGLRRLVEPSMLDSQYGIPLYQES